MILADSCATRYVGPLFLGGGKGCVHVSLGDALPEGIETPAVAQGAPPEKRPDSPAAVSAIARSETTPRAVFGHSEG